jgi:hypothetical protein
MSFDDQITKQDKILNHIKANIETIKTDEVRDYSQEFNRCDRILKHHLRGYNNPAGRYICSAAFGLGGLAIVLFRKPVRGGFFSLIRPEDFAIVGVSTILGYLYAGRFHGNNKEYKRLLAIYREKSLPLKEEFHQIVNKF